MVLGIRFRIGDHATVQRKIFIMTEKPKYKIEIVKKADERYYAEINGPCISFRDHIGFDSRKELREDLHRMIQSLSQGLYVVEDKESPRWKKDHEADPEGETK